VPEPRATLLLFAPLSSRSALPPGMRLERQGQQFVLRELLIRDVKLVAC